MKMKTQDRIDLTNGSVTKLTSRELEQIDGGKTVILDGATVEMSDNTIAMMINSGAVRRVVLQHPLGAGNPW